MSEKAQTWKRIGSKTIADCRVFKVREDLSQSDGRECSFYVIENPDWVNVIALTASQEVILIEQYRHGLEDVILEIPGGMVDEGEAPERAAARELLEETGFSSDRFVLLGRSHPNPAIQNNTLFHFLALDCRKTHAPAFDEHENAVTKLYPLARIGELIRTGKISHSLVVAAFQYLALREDSVEAK